jgi:hypothetical protein
MNIKAGIGKKHRIFTAGTGKQSGHNNHKQQHRRHTNKKISDEDTIVLELIYDNLKFYAASMYFDIQDQLGKSLDKMDEILKLTKSGKILIAADTDSRSKTWHNVITNTRGKTLEEYLAGTQLHIINEETKEVHSTTAEASAI